jgi:hypothetical protein
VDVRRSVVRAEFPEQPTTRAGPTGGGGTMKVRWMPYTSEDYTMESCRRQAEELRSSGRYQRVEIRRKRSEDGVEFGRVYVNDQESER